MRALINLRMRVRSRGAPITSRSFANSDETASGREALAARERGGGADDHPAVDARELLREPEAAQLPRLLHRVQTRHLAGRGPARSVGKRARLAPSSETTKKYGAKGRLE